MNALAAISNGFTSHTRWLGWDLPPPRRPSTRSAQSRRPIVLPTAPQDQRRSPRLATTTLSPQPPASP